MSLACTTDLVSFDAQRLATSLYTVDTGSNRLSSISLLTAAWPFSLKRGLRPLVVARNVADTSYALRNRPCRQVTVDAAPRAFRSIVYCVEFLFLYSIPFCLISISGFS